MFFKHVVSQLPLIADGHKSHLTIDVIDFFFSVYHHTLHMPFNPLMLQSSSHLKISVLKLFVHVA